MSGALMQGMTRNYLASPAIMGVTDGAAFVITLCMVDMAHQLEVLQIAKTAPLSWYCMI
ncbi:iron chelate uptake ABC transporter family permease subunit [Desulfosporosinus fructosivorans]